MLEHIEDGVLLADTTAVRSMNPAARRIFVAESVQIGRPLADVVRDQRIVALAARAREAGREEAAEVERASLSQVLAVRALPLEGGLIMVLCRDVSRLRYLETVRQQFVANLAHDMRTPLAGLDLAAQTLARELAPGGDAAVLLSRVLRESHRLQAMVKNLTQLAALDSSAVQIEHATFAVDELVSELIERNRLRAEECGLELSSRLPEAQLRIRGDRGKTEQALQNVVDNALKFTQRGWIQLTASSEDGRVEICVRDTGPGIPTRDLPRVFERFYKVDRSRSGQPGSGLGLSIARHLIELQGGTITVTGTRESDGSLKANTITIVPAGSGGGFGGFGGGNGGGGQP